MWVKRAANIGKFLVPLVVTFFIGRAIYGNWQQVREAEWHLRPAYLLASLLLCSPWFAVRPLVWGLILGRFDHPIPFRAAFRIFRLSELSRYVPGTVWQYLSRVYLAKAFGVGATVCLVATLIETVLLTLAALPPALWNLQALMPQLGRYHRIVLIVFPLLGLLVLHPRLLNLWVGFVSKRLGQPFTGLKMRWSTIAAVWLLYLVVWLLHVFGVALFVRGVMLLPWEHVPLVASDYAAAWLIGMLTMIAPAGMGIRDGALGLLLSLLVPLGTALTLALGIRLWLTFIELIWALVAQWLSQGIVEGGVAEPAGRRR